MDAYANLAKSVLANSPGLAGTTFQVSAGHGVRFPVGDFNLAIWPTLTTQDVSNTEYVRVTGHNGLADSFTGVARTQEGSVNVNAVAGYNIALVVSAKVIEDLQALVSGAGQVIAVDGGTYARTSAGIRAAIAAVTSGHRAHIVVSAGADITADGAKITIDKDYITLDFRCVYKHDVSATAYPLIEIKRSGVSAERLLAVDGAMGDKEIELAAGSVAAISLAAGDYVEILDATAASATAVQVTRVKALTGAESFSIDDALADTFTVAGGACIRKITDPVKGVRITGSGQLNGNGNTGATSRGVYIEHAVNTTIDSIEIFGTYMAGILATRHYRTRLDGVIGEQCGLNDGNVNNGEADFYIQRGGAATIIGCRSMRGYGPDFVYMHGAQIDNWATQQSLFRAFKTHHTRFAQGNNIYLANGAKTGLSPAFNSQYNVFSNVVIEGMSEPGLWVPDNTGGSQGNNDNNRFVNVVSRHNTTADIFFGSTSDNNRVIAATYGVLSDAGTGNSVNGMKVRTIPLPVRSAVGFTVETANLGTLPRNMAYYQLLDAVDGQLYFNPVPRPVDFFGSLNLCFRLAVAGTSAGTLAIHRGLGYAGDNDATETVTLNTESAQNAPTAALTFKDYRYAASAQPVAGDNLYPYLRFDRSTNSALDTNTGTLYVWDVWFEYVAQEPGL